MSPRRIDELTDEQRAAMDAHADRWIAYGWSTEPADWELFEDAAERCYGFAGLPWHGNVVRVSSPLVLSLAAPIAAYRLALINDTVDGAVDGAVGDAVDGAVGDAVDGAVRDAVRGAVDGAVRDAVRDAVDGAVRDAVDDAVRDAVRDAVDDAVDDAVRKGIYNTISRAWYYRLWGNLWTYWQSSNSFFREVCDLELDGDMWDRSRAYEDTAKAAGWWWPHKEFVMVCDRPAVLHVEQVGPRGWGSHRMHCEDGPAIAWRDGYALYYWHGVQVSRDLIEGRLSVGDILREPNAEVRRCAIERMGWADFVAQAGLRQIGVAVQDPGNPGHNLALYEVPERIYDEPVNVLLCTNGSAERDGTRRRFGLTCPASITDPVAAAAWGYDITPDEYRQLQVRR